MFQSMSTDENGNEMPKENVFASELDGHEWEIAPTILDYTASVVLQAPHLLNHFFPDLDISEQAYGTKLAVSLGAGSKCEFFSLLNSPPNPWYNTKYLRNRSKALRQLWTSRPTQSHDGVLFKSAVGAFAWRRTSHFHA
jgi:hypothetical protein